MDTLTNLAVTRRLTEGSVMSVSPEIFGQPVDINLSLDSGEKDLMPLFPSRSLSASLEFISECQAKGINCFMLRMVHGALRANVSFDQCLRRLSLQTEALTQIRNRHPEVELVLDPFGLALGADDQWGVVKHGGLSMHVTERFWTSAVEAYAKAGASWVLTLGRFPKEVLLASEALSTLDCGTRICCFSTNIETIEAYSYLVGEGQMIDSGQKILPGNVDEMLLWALADIACGAGMVIVKPCSNTHVLSEIIRLSSSAEARQAFLSKPVVKEMLLKLARESPQIVDRLEGSTFGDPRFGTYAISGHYQGLMDLRGKRGNEFALDAAREGHLSIVSAAALADAKVTIFDRTAGWVCSAT